MDLTSLLQDTLVSHGYRTEQAPALEGRSGATYPANLLAHQNEHRLLIDVTTNPISDADIQALDAIVQDTGVDAALLLALADEDDASTPSPRVTVWTRPQLEQAIGAQLLNDTLDDETDPSHIGPTPFDPERLPRSPVPDEEETTEDPAPSTQEPKPARTEPETTTPPQAQPQPHPEPEPSPATPAQSSKPSTPPPQPDRPEPATAQASSSNGGGYMDPEEMAKRAQEMLEQGDIPDDGDAEIITNDDPQPEPSPKPDAAHEAGPQPDPEAAPDLETQPAPEPGPMQEGQVFEDADCEILPSKPQPKQDEPANEERTTDKPPIDPPPSQPSQPTEEASSSLAALTANTPPEQGEKEPFLSGGCIPPTVTEDQARKAAQGALFNVQEARLELLPFHVFEYGCKLEGDGKARQEEGRVWISAQNGAIVNEPENANLIDDPGIPHERYQANLPPHQAQSKALQHLQDSLERREELREDYSETAIIERVTLKPNPATLTLDHQGTAYAPRWRLDGQNGNVYVDALTGEIVPA